MRLVSYPRSFFCVARHAPVELSPKAQVRLRLVRAWQQMRQRGLSGAEAAQVVGVSRASLYRWQEGLKREGLRGLEERSRRPNRVRMPLWREDLVGAVRQLREEYPRWGKEILVVLLERQGWKTSASTVGRILVRLKARGLLREAPRRLVCLRKRAVRRVYATRKPRDYAIGRPGDLVQVDTLDVRPLAGVAFKHYTARDVISRWDVVQAYGRATAKTATAFLDSLTARMPFPVRAIQVDGGSEFQAEFEQACAAQGIRLFVLPPRSPKLNAHVERAHRTHAEDFYDLYDGDLDLVAINRALHRWERVYNTIRPHRSLAKKTPAEYLQHYHLSAAPRAQLSHMS
jgi:transposase InsO family protein